MVTFFAGQLPKELGKLVNLTHFDAQFNSLSGVLSIRTGRLCFVLIFLLTFKFVPRGGVRPRPERAREAGQPDEALPPRERGPSSSGRRAFALDWRHGLFQPRGRCGVPSVLEMNSRENKVKGSALGLPLYGV